MEWGGQYEGSFEKGGEVVQIKDDDYDHWEFHNLLHLSPDYIHSLWVLLGLDFSLFDRSESEFPFHSEVPLVEVQPQLKAFPTL